MPLSATTSAGDYLHPIFRIPGRIYPVPIRLASWRLGISLSASISIGIVIRDAFSRIDLIYVFFTWKNKNFVIDWVNDFT